MGIDKVFSEIVRLLTNIDEKLSQQYRTSSNKDLNELLTSEQIKEETGIGINLVRKMMRDPKMCAQTTTIPYKVTRRNLYKYLEENRDYLKDEEE